MAPQRHEYITLVRLARGHLIESAKQTDRDLYTGWGVARIQRDPEALLADARDNTEDYDYLMFGAAAYLSTGWPLPLVVSDFVAMALIGERKRPPTRRGPRPKRAQDYRLFSAVEYLVSLGATPTRNNGNRPTSACDAVADAAGKLKIANVSFHRTKQLWDTYKGFPPSAC